ncbi:MAG TPA: hypothetical protein VFZ93_03155 [Albitalea sp.]
MSDAPEDFLAPPPFKPAEALQQLKRTLRDLRPLAERGEGFELHGLSVVELKADAGTIAVKLARRPARTPDWDRFVLKNNADVRKCVDEVKKRLARWTEE